MEAYRTRTINVQLGDVSRLVYTAYTWSMFSSGIEMIVKVDEKVAATSRVSFGERFISASKSMDFNLTGDTVPQAATIQISKNRWTGKITGCRLTVAGRVLYDE